jgi:pyruvate/2-oxoacid:ferredoxin oxidoreductase alpha subunit
VIVTMGSMTGTAREAVDALRNEGVAAGLLKIRLFRPFPTEDIRDALTGIPRVMVMDRNFAPGTGGVLFQEIRAALYDTPAPPQVHGYLTGVGGTSVSPDAIMDMARCAIAETPSTASVWRG